MYVLLKQVVITGPSQSKYLSKTTKDHLVECYYVDPDTSVTVVVVDLEQSLDPPEINDADSHWYRMAQHTFTSGELTVKQAAWAILNTPARRVRANIITITGADGSTDKFTVRYREEDEAR